jgi:hypothetical protein
MNYQPKGSMCAACQYRLLVCGHLDFNKMPVIKTDYDVAIVKCTEFKKALK